MDVALVGCGRMGEAIESQAVPRGHRVVARIGSGDAPINEAKQLAGAEVAFEFSTPGTAADNVAWLVEQGLGVVCGTTGWEPDVRDTNRLCGATLCAAVRALWLNRDYDENRRGREARLPRFTYMV